MAKATSNLHDVKLMRFYFGHYLVKLNCKAIFACKSILLMEEKQMKKLMMLVLALALSISCLAIPAGAVELEENQADAYMTIQPREFMTLSRTQRVVYNSSLNLAVDITVNFTVRGEAGNKSGFYITGMHSASAKR